MLHRPILSTPRPFISALIAAALLLPLVLSAAPARAQGTMGLLPGPMTTHELDGYAQRLNLSPQQRRAVDALHDQYKQEFRALREGEVAEFLKKTRESDRGGGMPSRKVVEDILQQMDVLAHKIAAIDSRFFDQLQTSLTEQQLSMLQRVRQARQRARLAGMQMMWMSGERPVDISEIAMALDLSAADREAIDPLLAPYEAKLTNDEEKLYGSTHKMILDMFDSLEKMGVTGDMSQDPAQAEKMAQAMQQVYADIMSKGQVAVKQMRETNDRTQRNIVAALSPEAGRNFRNRYFRQGYPEAAFALYAHDYVFAPALKRDDLTPQQRETVAAARDELYRRLDGILDQAVTQIAAFRGDVSPFNYDQEKAAQYQKSQQQLQAKAEEARASANASLEAALGKELLDKIGRIKPLREEPPDTEDGPVAVVGGGMGQVQVEIATDAAEEKMANDFSWGIDQFVPPAISETELADYTQRLSLTEEQKSVLRDLYQRYNDSFAGLNKAEFQRLQQATQGMWQYDEQTQTSHAPTAETINDVYRLRAAAVDAVKRTDDAFFSELELAVLTPEQVKALPRVRLARERTVYNRGAFYYGGDGNNEGSVDIARLVTRRRPAVPTEGWTAIDAELQKYEQEVIGLFRERYARSLDAQKVQELWSAEITRAQASGDANSNIKLGMRYQEMMREPQQALAKASGKVGELNRKTIEVIMPLLPGEAAQDLRGEYNRAAFPMVYNDNGALEKHLKRARALTDITAEQSQRLADVAAEYLPAYSGLCDQMVKASEGAERSNFMATMDESTVNDWQKREETLAKLRFDRSELNARTSGKIKDILNEDQIKKLGGLPKIEDEGNDW